MQKIAYVAGPYSALTPEGVQANIDSAEKVARKYTKLGYFCICPHMNTAHMEDLQPYEFFLDGSRKIIRTCIDTLILMDNWEDSPGAIDEYTRAVSLNQESPELIHFIFDDGSE